MSGHMVTDVLYVFGMRHNCHDQHSTGGNTVAPQGSLDLPLSSVQFHRLIINSVRRRLRRFRLLPLSAG